MGKVVIEGIKLKAYHGCLDEEGIIGCDYKVDVIAETDLTKACLTDDLSETIDYVVIYNEVKKQMAIRSKLIEHVGYRILKGVLSHYKHVKRLTVFVTKYNPPVNGYVENSKVELSYPEDYKG